MLLLLIHYTKSYLSHDRNIILFFLCIQGCICDLVVNGCDANCCCDEDCTAADKEVFTECKESRNVMYGNTIEIICSIYVDMILATSKLPFTIASWGCFGDENKGTVPQNSPIMQCNVAIPRLSAQLRSG